MVKTPYMLTECNYIMLNYIKLCPFLVYMCLYNGKKFLY